MVPLTVGLVQLFILLHGAFSNIVDTKFPIVIHDSSGGGQSNGYSSQNNYFGYSLAFMKGYLSDAGPPGAVHFEGSGDAKSTLFIGAPNETKSTKNAGVVWQCRFDGKDSKVSCSIYRLLSELNSPVVEPDCNLQSQKKFNFPEKQTEQWIGASLSVNPVSRQFLACAPRWKMNGFWINKNKYNCQMEETAMTGACFVASQESVIHELNPLNQPSDYYYPDRGVSGYYTLYAEFGFSSHFTDSGKLVVGAPSTRSWKGGVVEVNDLKPGGGGVSILTDVSGIGRNSYLGYTVTSGRARTRGYYIASGAPRANALYGGVTVSYPSNRPFAIYSGEQFGSYFGYALATVDLNGDGFDELLVGAPWHTQEFSSSSSYDTGCVLIFDLQLRSRKAIEKLCMDSQLISEGSRFGSAIAKIRDLNFDQQDDFAISAPYDDNGQGTIFIYHGGFPLSKHPAQVIRGRYLNIPNLHGFGTYLISGNQVDIDGNTTPDIVIGAYESRHVVVLRTRPVARASIKISFHTGESRGHDGRMNKYLPTQRNFRARTCVSFEFSISLPSEHQFALETWLSFELGPKLKQVQFENPGNQQEQLNQLSPFEETCVDTGLRVDGEIDTSNSDDFIQFRARLKYNQTETLENQLVQHASVTLSGSPNQQNRNQYSQAYNAFNEYLPIPISPMNSEWGLLSVAPDNCDSDGKLWCDVELSLQLKVYEVDPKTQDHKELTTGKPLVVGQLESLLIKVDIVNLKGKETAYNPIIWVTMGVSENFNMYPKYLSTLWEISGKPGRCRNLVAPSDKANGVTAAYFGQRCSLVIQPGSGLTLTMKSGNWGHLRVSNSSNGDRGFMTLKVEAFPELNMTQHVEKRIQTPLQADVNIDLKSSVPAEQLEIDPTFLRSKLVDIGQYYTIVNKGFSGTTMEAVTAEILVPTHVNLKGNWTEVIGVADPSTSVNENIRCTAEKFTFFVLPPQADMTGKQNSTFPDNLNDKKGGTYASKRRTTRSTKSTKVTPEKVSVTESSDRYITLSGCEGDRKLPDGKTCQKIICKMDLSSKATSPKEIKLQMYVLQNALGELVKAETKGIRVNSVISVYYQGRKVAQQSGVTERKFQLEKGISALVLLGAGAGGTILFILITFALFKCGFFRRKTKEQLIQLKRQTMQMNAQDLNQLQESLQAMEEDEQQNAYL